MSSCILNCPCTDKCRGMKCCPEDRHKLNKQPVWMRCCRARKKKPGLLNEIIVSPCEEKKVLLPEELAVPDKVKDKHGSVPSKPPKVKIAEPPDNRVNGEHAGVKSSETKQSLCPKDSVISAYSGSPEVTEDSGYRVNDSSAEDAKVSEFFKIPKIRVGGDDLTEQDNARPVEHPRSQSEPAKSEQPSLRRKNNSLPAINAAKYYPRFNPPNRLSRPQSMYAVPTPTRQSSSSIPRRTQSTDILAEAPEPEVPVTDDNATLPWKQNHLKPQTVDGATSTSSFRMCTSEDDLDRNIRRLKHDWKEIRGDMASTESFLNS